MENQAQPNASAPQIYITVWNKGWSHSGASWSYSMFLGEELIATRDFFWSRADAKREALALFKDLVDVGFL
jgi:hypothetical protein